MPNQKQHKPKAKPHPPQKRERGVRDAARSLAKFSRAKVTGAKPKPPPSQPKPNPRIGRPQPSGILLAQREGKTTGVPKVLSLADHDTTSMAAAYAYAMTTGPMAPMVFNKDNELCIQYRHPLIAVDVEPRATVHSDHYNPADPATCPFIASLLLPYTQHRVERIRFGYLGLVPTSYAGTVVLTASLSDDTPMPSDLLGALSYQGATSSPIWGLTWTDWMQVTPPMPPAGYDTTSLWRSNTVLSTLVDGQPVAPESPQVNYQVLVDGAATSNVAPIRCGVLWCEVKLWARRVKVATQAVLAMHEDVAANLNLTTSPGINKDCYANCTQNDTIIGAFGAAPNGTGLVTSTDPSNTAAMATILNNGSATFTIPDDYLATINFDSDWTKPDGTLVDDHGVSEGVTSSAQNWDYLPQRLRDQLEPETAEWYSLEHGDSYMDVAIIGVADGITVFWLDPESYVMGDDAHHVHRKLSKLLHKRDPDAPDAVGDILSKLWGVAKAGGNAALAIGSTIATTAVPVASQALNLLTGGILKSVFDVATGLPSAFFHTLSRVDTLRKLKHINAAVVVRNPADTMEGGAVPGPTLRSTISGRSDSLQQGAPAIRSPFKHDGRRKADAKEDAVDCVTPAGVDEGDGWVAVPQQLRPATSRGVPSASDATTTSHADRFRSPMMAVEPVEAAVPPPTPRPGVGGTAAAAAAYPAALAARR